MKRIHFWGIIIVSLFVCINAFGENLCLSPISFGINDCISDIQRYYVLQEVHEEALRKGCGVDYTGIDTLNIEIPRDAQPLPLTDYTDFAGVVLNVKNRVKHMPLFFMKKIAEVEELNVTWEQIKKGKIPQREHYYHILIEDQEPWVKNRIGYNFGHNRRDILLVKNGKIQNKVIASYGTKASRPKFEICNVSNGPKVIKNLTVNRDSVSTCRTHVFSVENQNDVKIQNITINTPSPGELYADTAIGFYNCTNLQIDNVTINGTYSQGNMFGYGIHMDNVWNVSFDHLKAYGNWGVFGTGNVNTVKLVDCDINRFDVHCYGKDILCRNSIFRNYYNSLGSVFGTVLFDNCSFINTIPMLLDSDYNAYTLFNLIFRDCTWIIKQKSQNYLVGIWKIYEFENPRPELKQRHWPDVLITNMKIVSTPETNEVVLLKREDKIIKSIKTRFIKKLEIKGVSL